MKQDSSMAIGKTTDLDAENQLMTGKNSEKKVKKLVEIIFERL